MFSRLLLQKRKNQGLFGKGLSYKTHVWYEGTSHQYTYFGTKVNVICQGQISSSRFEYKWPLRGIPVSQTHVFFICMYEYTFICCLQNFIQIIDNKKSRSRPSSIVAIEGSPRERSESESGSRIIPSKPRSRCYFLLPWQNTILFWCYYET